MGAIEISIIVIAAVIVVAVIVGTIVHKVQGKSSCCSDCSSCPHSKMCSDKLNEVRAAKANEYNCTTEIDTREHCCSCSEHDVN